MTVLVCTPAVTDPDASNYDSTANVTTARVCSPAVSTPARSTTIATANTDDGSCQYAGCVDADSVQLRRRRRRGRRFLSVPGLY